MSSLRKPKGGRSGLVGLLLVVATLLATSASAVDTTSTSGVRIATLPWDGPVKMQGDAIAFGPQGPTGVWPGSGPITQLFHSFPAGADGGRIADMNASHQVVGYYTLGGAQQAFIWSEAAGSTDIPAPPGLVPGGIFQATGLSDDGWIVGRYRGEAGTCFTEENTCGFLAVPNGAGYAVTTFDQPEPWATFFVNDIELVTVGGVTQHIAVGDGLAWSDASGLPGAFTVLHTGSATTFAHVFDVNRSGEIVGSTSSAGAVQAAYWASPTAASTGLGFLGTDTRSDATRINDAGHIIGTSGDYPTYSAVVWEPGTGIRDLGHLDDVTTLSRPTAINEDGIIIGLSGDEPVLWDRSGAYDLGAVIEIDPIPDQSVEPGAFVNFFVTQTGAVTPSFFLSGGEPPDLTAPHPNSLISADGEFLFFTSEADIGEHVFTVSVWDDSNPISPTATETFTITVAHSDVINIVVTESIAVSDDVVVLLPLLIQVTESVAVSDEVGVHPPIQISITESVAVSDAVIVVPPVLIQVTESIAVADQVGVLPPIQISITESVAVDDGVGVAPSVLIQISETLVVSDEVDVRSEVDPNGDLDGDGITNSVDEELLTPSDAFTDAPLGGSTFGVIVDRGNQDVTIGDSADQAKGVTAVVVGPAGEYAEIGFCKIPTQVWGGTKADFTCGSLLVEVETGLVTVLTSDGAEVDVGEGSSVLIDDDGTNVTIEVLAGSATVRDGDVTIVLNEGDLLDNPGQLNDDTDEDGLTGYEELLTGTDPGDPDSDGDGLLDGIDPTWLDQFVAEQPGSIFSHELTGEQRLRLRVAATQNLIAVGARKGALSLIDALALKTDGCGAEPDANDWITHCDTQAEFKVLLALLGRNVAVMDLPDPPSWWE